MDNIELKSEKVRNIVGRMPPTIIRYGCCIITLVIVTVIGVSMLIPYKETLTINIHLTPTVSKTIATARLTSKEVSQISKGMLFSTEISGENIDLRLDSVSLYRIDGRYLCTFTLTENDRMTQNMIVKANATFSNCNYFEKLIGFRIFNLQRL